VNIRQYHREVKRTTSNDISREHALCVGGLGLTGEAGEVADLIKKHVFHGHELDLNEMRKELGDVLWYLTFLCNALGITLSEVMEVNAAKLRIRYPDGWSQEASVRRADEGVA